jgi:hypothetical protein
MALRDECCPAFPAVRDEDPTPVTGQVNGRCQTGGTATYDETVNHGCTSHGLTTVTQIVLSTYLNLTFRSTDLLFDIERLASCSKQPTRTQPHGSRRSSRDVKESLFF